MENSEQQEKRNNQSSWILIGAIILLVIALSYWFTQQDSPAPIEVAPDIIVDEPIAEIIPIEPVVIEEEIEEVVQVAIEVPVAEIEPVEESELPTLNESDVWVSDNLTTLTWRKELLKLVIDEDIIRRLVVFTDNFSQGTVAYKHSPLVAPTTTFTAIETPSNNNNAQEWLWDPQSEKRFNSYIELLRSLDSESLIAYYYEIKPLIDEAYAELGYEDDDFTDTLQAAITRILDAELPKTSPKVIRPSVMYKYEDEQLESLDDVDKLLIRLGKENVLIIKSILLEFNEKLSIEENR